jgi:NAD(P)-dependent dehydrogenase (short-subunit alcohol dehydrogenase family)
VDDLVDRCAVITGAASGIGRGMARAFTDAGMRVVVADIDAGRARDVAAELQGAGGRCVALPVDVRDPASVDRLREAVHRSFGDVHLLCNNAGVVVMRPIVEATPLDWDYVMGVNVLGVVNGLRSFLPRMYEMPEPSHVVNTASMASLAVGQGGPMTLYSASKFGVLGLCEALFAELAEHGVGQTILCPGQTASDLPRTSARNHPDPRPSPAELPSEEDRLRSGRLDPLFVGRLALEAVRRGERYCLTHPSQWPRVREQQERIADAFADTAARWEELQELDPRRQRCAE